MLDPSSPDHPCEPLKTDPATIARDDSIDAAGAVAVLPFAASNTDPTAHAVALVDAALDYLNTGRVVLARMALDALRGVVEGLGGVEGETAAEGRSRAG